MNEPLFPLSIVFDIPPKPASIAPLPTGEALAAEVNRILSYLVVTATSTAAVTFHNSDLLEAHRVLESAGYQLQMDFTSASIPGWKAKVNGPRGFRLEVGRQFVGDPTAADVFRVTSQGFSTGAPLELNHRSR